MSNKCPECGESFKALGIHWRKGGCNHPPFTKEQDEIITGLVMGDGCINLTTKTPRLQINMTSKEYLIHLDDIFGILSTGVTLHQTAKERANQNNESGFHPDADEKNYKDAYWLQTRSHPGLSKFADWYESGKKVWPDDIELSPTVLKHWFVGDGSWHNTSGQNYIRIAMSNEKENVEKVSQYFTDCGLPQPNFQTNGEYCAASFTVSESVELWEYMGEPLPGFEYKWPDRYC